jgi:alpha-ketoglutarate-dependent taurine dioxygenase
MLVHAPTPDQPYAIVEADGAPRASSLEDEPLIELYKRHGALLLRGFGLDMADFRAFANKLCSSSVFNESADRKLLDGDYKIQSVNGGSEPFPLHPEISREPWKPDVCFFWCIQPPSRGGETLVCDGVELVRRLPPHLRDFYAARRLRYAAPASPDACERWLGTAEPTAEQLSNPPRSCP